MDKHVYEALDRLEELDFTVIEDKVFAILSKERKERLAMVLDVTDTYFNGVNADWKARKGKYGKYDKFLQIALAVTKEEGFPILHKLYEGNIGNSKIFKDMLADIRLKKFDVIILDRGMIISTGNPKELVADHPEFKNLENLFLHLTGKGLRD